MAFETDVFISYAHLDNESPFEGEPGWVSAFHRALEVYLGQLLGHKASIWRDPKLQGNDIFADTLADKLSDVAALVCVLSPNYVNSEWCAKELKAFCEAARSGPSTGRKARIFKVVKMPVPLEEHPEEVQPLLGYDFFKVHDEKGAFVPLDPSIDPSMKPDYFVTLNDLAQHLCGLLGSVNAEEAAPAIGVDNADPDKPAIFLAQTTFDLKLEHGKIKRDLVRHGYRVLPDENLPLATDELEASVRRQLEDCRLSIHLIGKSYGVVPEGSAESVVSLQNALAAERCETGDFHRLIHLTDGHEIADERQRDFIDFLRGDNRNHVGADLLEGCLEDFKTAIHHWLEPQEREACGVSPAGELTRVYLICDDRDDDAAAPLEEYLYDKGLEVILPVFEGSEEQLRVDHQESLATSDAILVYYGEGNELWLRRKLRELLKSGGYGRKRRLLAQAVYVAPPTTPQKERVRTREALVLRPRQHPDRQALDAFLNEIERARAKLAV